MKERIVLFLVTFYGIPDWGEGLPTHPHTRRYLFSTFDKASSFVKRRTSSAEWMTHPAYPQGSMDFRLKKGSPNRYTIVSLFLDEVYDEDLSNDSVQQSKS